MTTLHFSLLTGETGPLVKGATPGRVSISIHEHTPILATNDQVLAGTKIATAKVTGLGDLHSPVAGTIKAVTSKAMLIEVSGNGRAEVQKPPNEGGDSLKEWLRNQGIDVRQICPSPILIINAVPPEPGISIYEPLLRDYRKTIELGMETIQRIVTPAKMHLVAAKGNRANAFANCTIMHVPPIYPNGLDQLVIKAVTGQETLLGSKPGNAVLLSVKTLYFIGRVMETGRPLTETILSIGGQNHLIDLGTPVGFLVNEAGASVQPGDRIILGGLFRGMPAISLEQGVDKETIGIHLVPENEGLKTSDNFCLGCGECERHCPARIMPGMISRCSEFKHFQRAEIFHIHSCIECGICGYWCKAKRPLLQYIRLAKYELALLESSSSLTRSPDEKTDATQPSGENAQ